MVVGHDILSGRLVDDKPASVEVREGEVVVWGPGSEGDRRSQPPRRYCLSVVHVWTAVGHAHHAHTLPCVACEDDM